MSAGGIDSETSNPPEERRSRDYGRWLAKPKPISLYLFLLILVTILPAIAVSMVLLTRNNDSQRQAVNTLAEAAAGSISQAVDRELSSMLTALRVLATSPSLGDGDRAELYTRAKSALADTGAYFVLLDENLNQLMNTRVPLGEPLPEIADSGPARQALSTRMPVISGVFFGNTARKWVFNTLLPVFPADGPPLVLVLTRNAEDLSSALSEQNLRGGWNASIVDASGDVVTSSFMSANTGKPFFLLPVGDGRQSHTGAITEDSPPESYDTVAKYSDYSGWKVVLWAPTSTITAPMRHSMFSLLIGGLVVIAIGAVAAWLLGSQVSKSVQKLAGDARRLGAGEPVERAVYPIAEVTTVASALAEASIERKRAENEIRLLMREVAHRAKNQLTVVASIAKQTARSARSFSAFQDTFQKRLYGLARSTDLLIAGGAAGVELRELLVAQIEPFRPEDPKRLDLSGPQFRLANQAAQSIGLAIHELSTNAAKYGAFARENGRLSLSWQVKGDKLEIVWREYVSRLRRRPTNRGFGTEIIERMVGGTLDAEIQRVFHRDGLECTFLIPIARLVPERQVADHPAA
jgi:two-component sensor histidine kinase